MNNAVNFRWPILAAWLSGVLLWLSWPVSGIPGLIFLAWVPMLWSWPSLAQRSIAYRCASWYGLALIWNTGTTWWIVNASLGGALLAICANSLLMAGILEAGHTVFRKRGFVWGIVALTGLWLGFERVHLNWELTWPWLTLGNAFSEQPLWVQWYSITGHLGGSVWVWATNALAAVAWIPGGTNTLNKRVITLCAATVAIPIFLSACMHSMPMEKGPMQEVVVVQPNVDPYNEKFSGIEPIQQLKHACSLAQPYLTPNTQWLIFPETVIPYDVWENKLDSTPEILFLREFACRYPKLAIVLGSGTARAYLNAASPQTESARALYGGNGYYDSYNTGLMVACKGPIPIYHKSRLVPGVEKIPFAWIFGHLESLAINLGGTMGSLGTQVERSVFPHPLGCATFAPIICYESVYGDFVADYVRKGAQVLCIMTNDGWWGDTPGYKQHLSYARLRAIETGRWVVRSANTGTSALIDPQGKMVHRTDWWQPKAFRATFPALSNATWFVRLGDDWSVVIGFVGLLMWASIVFGPIGKLAFNKTKRPRGGKNSTS